MSEQAAQPCILIVEAELLVRHPLAEYLRECGYKVLEAIDGVEARELISHSDVTVDIVLGDAGADPNDVFGLASWIRTHHPEIQTILAGSIAKAAAKAGDLCEEGPEENFSYDHKFVLDRIHSLLAGRDRARKKS